MEVKNRMYQLYELRDEIKKTINYSEQNEEKEKLLIKLIIESNVGGLFKDFVTSLKQNWEDYKKQRIVLKKRLEKIEYLISIYEKKDDASKVLENTISLTLEALGAETEEPKKEKKKK